MADLTAYAYELNPRLRQDACLFSCIQFRNLFAQRLSVIKPANGPREFILSSDRFRDWGSAKHTNVRPAHLSGAGFLSLISNQNCGVLREELGGCPDKDPGQRNLYFQDCPLAS
jgi:hypothetical protein